MNSENKLNDVKRAILSTFGVAEFIDVGQMTTGLSNALVYRIMVQGKPFLLKIVRTDFETFYRNGL